MRTPTTLLFLAIVPLLSLQARQDHEDEEEHAVTASVPALPKVSGNAEDAAKSVEAAYAAIADRVWPSIVTVRAYEKVSAEDAGPVVVDGWVADTEESLPRLP